MSLWHDFLRERGASFGDAAVSDFGDAAAELGAARDTAVLCDLAPCGVIAIEGPDAASFLQGQFTNDVTRLEAGASQRSAWCSPKGRVLANFLLRRASAERFELLLPGALVEPIAQRLRMYVLRAKVGVADASGETVRLGLGGPAAAAGVAATIGGTPTVHRSITLDGASLVVLADNRFLLLASPEAAPALWNALAARARPAGFVCWEWLTVRAGVPVVTPATQELFLPQMLNLDALGAVAFDKGCYAGQEIVARAQYLGRLKERLALAHVDAAPPATGTRLYASAFGDQPCATVVGAAPAPGGGADLLAVAQISALGHSLRLEERDGPPAAQLPLPYPVPAARTRPGRTA
ncbi:MAG TPA: folate-binding protein [Casimicrobiaceae bacterium]|nr:folate-binding protein [Casimicrobiaceae bacterium]